MGLKTEIAQLPSVQLLIKCSVFHYYPALGIVRLLQLPVTQLLCTGLPVSCRLGSSSWAEKVAWFKMDLPLQPGTGSYPSLSVLVERSQVNSAKSLTGSLRRGPGEGRASLQLILLR